MTKEAMKAHLEANPISRIEALIIALGACARCGWSPSNWPTDQWFDLYGLSCNAWTDDGKQQLAVYPTYHNYRGFVQADTSIVIAEFTAADLYPEVFDFDMCGQELLHAINAEENKN